MTKPLTGPILIVGSSNDAPDLRYGSGFVAVDPVVFLDTRHEKHLVVPMLELGRARREARGTIVNTPQDLRIPGSRRRSAAEWAVALLQSRGIRRVTVPPSFPAMVMRRLESAGVRVLVHGGSVYPQRAIKKPLEIKHIREVQGAAIRALKAAVGVIRRAKIRSSGVLTVDGETLTSERLRAIIEESLLHDDCLARDTIVACGRQAADPHERGSGPVRAGEPIVIDIFPQHKKHGYWGDVTRTVIKGAMSAELRKMFHAVEIAQRMALDMIRPGVSTKRVHEKVQSYFEQCGFKTGMKRGVPEGFIHGTGHGVGLEIHEAPSVSLSSDRLRAGHVVTVEPGLYYARWGGIRMEDTVVVTRNGWRYLAPCPKKFRV